MERQSGERLNVGKSEQSRESECQNRDRSELKLVEPVASKQGLCLTIEDQAPLA